MLRPKGAGGSPVVACGHEAKEAHPLLQGSHDRRARLLQGGHDTVKKALKEDGHGTEGHQGALLGLETIGAKTPRLGPASYWRVGCSGKRSTRRGKVDQIDPVVLNEEKNPLEKAGVGDIIGRGPVQVQRRAADKASAGHFGRHNRSP